MVCHEFKGGIGTASRLVDSGSGAAWTLGVLVQANHGVRSRLMIDGAPVGAIVGTDQVPLPSPPTGAPGAGSIIVVVATDAPLLPHQCAALAKRTALGIARTGGAAERDSGDFAIAFSTANRPGGESAGQLMTVQAIAGDAITPLYYAAIEATEQAIVNALVAAETMTGRDGHTVHGLRGDLLASILRSASEREGRRAREKGET
jgi:D-aminopeptidase